MTAGETLGGLWKKSIETVDVDDPLYIHPTDTITGTIISFKLLGTENFRVFKSVMTRALKAKNKHCFVDGTVTKVENDPIKSLKWERANVVVCSWLLGVISQNIYAGHTGSEKTVEIWNELNENYFKCEGSVIFNVHQKVNSLTQSGLSASDQYNKLDSFWKEFDRLTNLTECICAASTPLINHFKLMKLMQFLSGVDDCYNQVKSHLLLTDHLPNVINAFAIISREESFQKNGSMQNAS